jgi:cell division transport system ATP-binding protein
MDSLRQKFQVPKDSFFSASKGVVRDFEKKALFSCENLNVNVKSLRILNSIGLEIYEGEFVFLTGPTGAGKSTLLNIIAKDKQDYKLKGKVKWQTQFVSRVFQDLKVFKSLSIYENLKFSYDKTLYESEDLFLEEATNYLRILGEKLSLNKKVEDLNGGLVQKVAIVRALLAMPQVLVLDEPTSALDRKSSILIYDLLAHVNRRSQTTIIWATHDQELIKSLNGRVLHLDKGKLVYSGKTCFI